MHAIPDPPAPAPQPVAQRRSGENVGDRVFRSSTIVLAAVNPLILGMLALLLFIDGWPALQKEGLSFLATTTWDPVFTEFGTAHFIFGTIVTSLIALVLGAPIAVGAALFLAEYAPDWLREPVSYIIEMLAVIPSIIYGLWGFFVLAPFMRATVEPFLREYIGPLPVIGALFSGPAVGKDMLTAGVILAIMILPTITSIAREIIKAVPDQQREGMVALGATKWEMITGAVLPYARAGIVGGVMLGLGRALGETMAVTMVIGNSSAQITPSLFNPGYTMASAIANQFREADSDIYFSAIVAVAVVLLFVTAIVNGLARLLIWKMARGPVGLRI
ncbi:MAG: phosphate ABC transporter permease subunit PstC [Dehalococcoidia bacterium]|nr:phosphate ABC transporter permease subunit PstC [Dehalococcoidia bacterium]